MQIEGVVDACADAHRVIDCRRRRADIHVPKRSRQPAQRLAQLQRPILGDVNRQPDYGTGERAGARRPHDNDLMTDRVERVYRHQRRPFHPSAKTTHRQSAATTTEIP